MTQRNPRPLPVIDDETRERQKERLLRNRRVDPVKGCWIWQLALTKAGYGQTSMLNAPWPAHRLAYFLFVGDFDPSLDIDHLCRVRACCNPAHLEPVPAKVNLLRSTNHVAAQVKATHCPKGHPYSGDNLVIRPSGRRGCRACIDQWKKESIERRAGLPITPRVTHCKRGHEYTEENTRWNPITGGRQCRTCNIDLARERRRRRRAA